MGIERSEIEPAHETVPTELELFNYPPNFLAESRQLFEGLTNLSRMNLTNTKIWEGQKHRFIETLDKISSTETDIAKHLNSVTSSITVSKAYLFFLDEFLPKGILEDDIFPFFETCLANNTKICATLIPELKDGVVKKASTLVLSRRQAIANDIINIVKSTNNKQPDWFIGSKEKYFQFLTEHSAFARLFNSGQDSTQTGAIKKIQESNNKLKTLRWTPSSIQ